MKEMTDKERDQLTEMLAELDVNATIAEAEVLEAVGTAQVHLMPNSAPLVTALFHTPARVLVI